MLKKTSLSVAMVVFLTTGFTFLSATVCQEHCDTCVSTYELCVNYGFPSGGDCDAYLNECLANCSDDVLQTC